MNQALQQQGAGGKKQPHQQNRNNRGGGGLPLGKLDDKAVLARLARQDRIEDEDRAAATKKTEEEKLAAEKEKAAEKAKTAAEKAAEEAKKIRDAFAKVYGAVSAVLGNGTIAQYPMYQRVLQERWDEVVAYFATPTELEDFYLALTGMENGLDGFIKSLLMEKDSNRRIEFARRAIPNI
ncbi:MAG: hypothetical protein AAB880_01325 [Patescibacteria group bacterium]